MDFCPNCGSMIMHGTICPMCGEDINGFRFEKLKIGVPKQFITNGTDYKNNISKVIDLIEIMMN